MDLPFCGMKKTIRSPHGILISGEEADIFQLENDKGSTLRLSSYGARWVGFTTADRSGKFEDVVVGPETLQAFEHHDAFFGCAVGRYANRIADGSFQLGGKSYSLAKNLNDQVHLHGGIKGFDKYVWKAELLEKAGKCGVLFTHFSPDGDEGYPGNVEATVTYWLTEKDEVIISYTAHSDSPTHVNLTNHAYFNLCGGVKRNVLDHELQLFADQFTETDDQLVPTGSLAGVEGTPLDFRKGKSLGHDIEANDRLIRIGNGYDHNFVINPSDSHLAPVAIIREPESGRKMEVFSSQPGVQLYTANWFDGSNISKEGNPIEKRYAFCLECQHFPDSPNHPNFPTTLLEPGHKYEHTSVYAFSLMD